MIDIRLERCLVEDFQVHQYIGSCEYGVKGTGVKEKSDRHDFSTTIASIKILKRQSASSSTRKRYYRSNFLIKAKILLNGFFLTLTVFYSHTYGIFRSYTTHSKSLFIMQEKIQ